MKPRFRFLAALFALTALVLLQGEVLWASSSCAGGMEMEMEMGMDAPATAHPDTHAPDHRTDAPPCPLMPSGAASCVAAALMLPSGDAPPPGAPEHELAIAASDHAKDLLLAVSLLRPPRA